jgi:hypothetical protein
MTRRRDPGLLMLIALFAAACGGSDDDDGATTGTPRAALILAECAKLSACTGAAANDCFGSVANKDSWQPFESFEEAREIELRADCMAAAEDCEQVLSCIDEGAKAFDDEQAALAANASCDQPEEYTYCEDDVLVWCFVDEYDTEGTPIPIDVGALGKTCNAAGSYSADPDHPVCDDGDGYADGCDGSGAFECVGGERTTWDCRDIDPQFVCTKDTDEPERPLCTMPVESQECEPGNFTNDGDWGTCEGDVASICAGRKFYEVDCSAFLGASCVQEDYSEWPEAFCQI